MSLYGTLNQLRRVSIYDEFCKKPSAVLIATDIAARGLGQSFAVTLFHLKNLIKNLVGISVNYSIA